MTAYQWAMLLIAVGGFSLTLLTGIVSLTRAVERIKADTSEKIADLNAIMLGRLSELADKFDKDQRVQDHNFGEVGAAMRQYVADVEKKVREVEIWGRDHYVLKEDFMVATDAIRADIRAMASDIKSDLKDLNAKIDTKT